jgi:crotonobetainyl-CoA:carnitine CoA-transferase CaiB-like acyl-CoA transferase
VPWELFALTFDALDLALDPALAPPRGFLENKARLDDVLAQSLRTQPRQHWFARARENGIAAGMLQTLDDVLACPQLAERGSFDELEAASGARARFPSEPYWVDGGREQTLRNAPGLGEHNRQIVAELETMASARSAIRLPSSVVEQPALAGIRVLDNGIVEAGTYPTRCLADFGAEVVRVENYPVPDVSRNATVPDGEPDAPYWEEGGVYHERHRNKDHCIGLDLRQHAAREAFLRLCITCDVVIDSHPPDVMERLGLGPEALRRLKPDLVVITTSGYGYGGPYTATRSYGMMTELMCGLSSLNGYPDGEPRRGTIPITDNESVFHIAFVIMAALERRDRTGEGAWIDVSQYEVGINVLGDR